jgi:flagellar motor switch protein FliN/FliY
MSDDPAPATELFPAPFPPRVSTASSPAPASAAPATAPVFREISSTQSRQPLEHLGNVELAVSMELGRVRMRLADVLKIGVGAVLELDKLAGDPIDVVVNGRLVARGEVVVVNERFAVRIVQIVADVTQDRG